VDIEKEIISYLSKYGNTRESDVINYGVKRSDYSPKEMKKVIKRMVAKNEIHYFVHSKLEPT
jgi:predicted transcriptional regulator